MNNFDLIVIGSGPAGEKGAAQAAYFGYSVALVEKESVPGGACVNTGTIPSKTLRESALHLSGFRQRGMFGVDLAIRKDISVADFMYRKNVVVKMDWERINANLERHRVERFHGHARFRSPFEVEVEQSDGKTVLTGKIILIAVGSSPHHPEGVPFDDKTIYDSDAILNLDRIPPSLAVIGAGVIGCEYASIFAALGVKVTLIDGRTSLLGNVDREIVEVLLRSFRERLDIDVRIGHEVSGLEVDSSGVTLSLGEEKIRAQKVLYAAGRKSNTGDLGLENAGVETGKRGLITVNEKYQTNVEHIYAAGDVIGFPALATTSMEQARVAMVHAFDLKYKTKVASILPYGIYTIPELSMVGLTEDECRNRGLDYEVGRAYYRHNARGQIIGDEDGLVKLVFDARSLSLLGVHVVGENASELLHLGMLTMHFGGTINTFIESVFNFPTIGEAYKYAAYDGLGRLARRSGQTGLKEES